MLKLYPYRLNNKIEIKILFFKKESQLRNRNFLIAFTLALLLHLIPLYLFKCTPPHINYAENLLTPTQLQIDQLQTQTLTHILKQSFELSTIQAIIPPDPPLTLLNETALNNDTFLSFAEESSIKEFPIDDPFEELVHDHSPINISLEFPELVVRSCGLLNKKLLNPPIHFLQTTIQNLEQIKLILSVIVEKESGKICWYDIKNEPPKDSLKKIEKLLRNLYFDTDTADSFTTGELEIIIHRIKK